MGGREGEKKGEYRAKSRHAEGFYCQDLQKNGLAQAPERWLICGGRRKKGEKKKKRGREGHRERSGWFFLPALICFHQMCEKEEPFWRGGGEEKKRGRKSTLTPYPGGEAVGNTGWKGGKKGEGWGRRFILRFPSPTLPSSEAGAR